MTSLLVKSISPITQPAFNGVSTLVATVASPGDLVHTVTTSGEAWEEITVKAWNRDAAPHTVTLQFGSLTSLCPTLLPVGSGEVTIRVGWLRNTYPNAALEVRAYADLANMVEVKAEATLVQATL